MKKKLLWFGVGSIYLLMVLSCAVPPMPSSSPGGSQGNVSPTPQQERPGLATTWGETRDSRVQETSFTRANYANPTATAAIYYNDEEGIRAMTGSSGQRTSAELLPVPSNAYNLVSFGIHDEAGRTLEGLTMDGKRYVLGEAGSRYSIVVRNNTGNRLEAVLSVDGLDVLDGKAAAVTKNGYVISPYSTLTVDGFRQSMDTVAAFRFGSVQESYANQKYGDSRNVGVIGLAIFHEMGTNPFATHDEVQRRHSADPFPNRFATPP